MCNLPNMQRSDLNEIPKPERKQKREIEVDPVNMFTVDYKLLKNLR
jgi:hypothetical protein